MSDDKNKSSDKPDNSDKPDSSDKKEPKKPSKAELTADDKQPSEKDSSQASKPEALISESAPKKETAQASTQAKAETTSAPAMFDNKSMPKMETRRRVRKTPIVSIIAIIVALLTLGGVGWGAYQQFLMQQSWQDLQTNINQQINQQVSVNSQSAQAAKTGLETANANQQLIRRQNDLINQLRESLTVTQERLKDLSGRRNQDWLLAEAEYLIKLAEYKITLESDKRTSIGLLKAADEKVMSIGDSSLIELRQAIAQDISNLQLLVAPDISGIAVQLDTLSDQIPALSIIALEFEPIEEQMTDDTTQSETFTWEKFYQNFLDDFVTVKDHSEPVKPLMTLEQRGLLNANIQLALQQAQVAVLRGEQGLYLSNIDNAIDWISTFFKKDEAATTLLANLKNLRDTRIVMDMPNSLNARKQIESVNQDRLYQWLDANQPGNTNLPSDDEAEQLP